MSLQLHYRLFSENADTSLAPIVILHGLFGSGKNWISHSRDLSSLGYSVYTVDHRNHGDSPWSDEHSLQSMTDDIINFHNQTIQRPAIYLGHSMGGLVAMTLSLSHPELVKGLVVADIAPKAYKPHHQLEFAALHIDISNMKSRQEVDQAMAIVHPNQAVRQFLQMNLERKDTGFEWKVNVNALEKAEYLTEFDTYFTNKSTKYVGPALFLKGKRSPYITGADFQLIQKWFPNSIIHTLEADHWLHYTNYNDFMAEIKQFFASFA
ncbi:MAG: alpha/beta fold hydrolase [Leptonema sp. (in: Bacteria)]|nr:alpha/beta fold hydrolase [Leptonema sp. (in: bacteria)]